MKRFAHVVLNSSHRLGMILPLVILATSALRPATFPTGFGSTLITASVSSPTAMAFTPDGRLFVCEQWGNLRVIKNDVLLARPFLNVSVNSAGERGLLGVAIDPAFNTNHFVYIYYTTTSPAIHNRISRFTAGGDTAVTGSELVLLNLDNLGPSNHNGGAIHFGPQGKLFVGVGENGTGSNAQTLNNLLGKILRINSDGSIPIDNPFYNTATGNNRAIWAIGFRNPFTFAFQPPNSSRMLINDVGEDTWEEVNDGIAGSNYGWPTTEGFTSNGNFRGPMSAYNHSGGAFNGCAIIGGSFYNPTTVAYPASYVGDYFFADYCSGWIRVFHPADSTTRSFGTAISTPTDLAVSPSGNLYYSYQGGGGGIAKVTYNLPLPIQLLSFTGIVTGSYDVQLSWTTVGEVNNYGFYIQRKPLNVQEYTEVPGSFVPGHGTTNETHTYTFTDTTVSLGVWLYRLRQLDLDGTSHFSEPITISITTGVDENSAALNFALSQNFPNPFNPATTIKFNLPQTGYTTLKIFNLLGEVVAKLVDGVVEKGPQTITWDASAVPTGLYLYRLESQGAVQTKKLVLVR